MRLSALLAALILAGVPASAFAQDNRFAVGVSGGLTNWEAEASSLSLEESGMSAGVMARYTVPLGNDTFAGFQTSVSVLEGAEWNEQGSVTVGTASVSAALTGEIDWTADALALVGVQLAGDTALYVGAGLAMARGSIDVQGKVAGTNAQNQPVSLAYATSESGSHTGYKIAAGLDLPFSETFGMLLQIDYADYGEDDYGALPVGLTAMGVRTAVLYRF